MQAHNQIPFLEEWLRSQITGDGGRSPQPPSQPTKATTVLQAWADIRNNHHDHKRLLDSLQALLSSQSTLHVADPQGKLLLSILSSTSAPPPPQSLPLLYRLLYIWVRKSHHWSPALLDSAVKVATSSSYLSIYPEETILLLGAIAAVPTLPEDSRRVCLDFVCRLIEEGRPVIRSPRALVFAGIGYALSRCSVPYFTKVLRLLLGIWNREDLVAATLKDGIMILGLVEWLVMGLINSRSLEKIDIICNEVCSDYARFVVVMSSAGVLRAFRRVGPSNRLDLNPKAKHMIERSISGVATHVVSGVGNDYKLNDDQEKHLIVQCISLGLARCGPYPSNRDVLQCICLALLNDVFPMRLFVEVGITSIGGLSRVKEHMNGVLFREAGAISGVLCNQYAASSSSSSKESMSLIENHVWTYSQEFYSNLRSTLFALKGSEEELLKELEKMAESIFLMVIVFSAAVAKQKLDPKSYDPIKSDVAANILVAFSCIEVLRRVRWPEYTDIVRRAVLTLQENASASTLFIDSMPAYDDLTNGKGSSFRPGLKYVWSNDEVQSARLLFYLRVMPTCIGHISSSTFRKKVAPIMFLYMHHPNVKISQASHSVFVAFISSGKDSGLEGQVELKEQLVFYYMQRALEAYPQLTPYKGMAAGISAIVRHLPTGSPAIFYCIDSLMEKTTSLFSSAIKDDADLWKNWQGDSEPCKNVLELLLHLVTLVDIQVLPNMLKLLAQFISQLPKEGRDIVLDNVYANVAESDDVTRKPTLVSWLQSISYISSQTTSLFTSDAQSSNKQGDSKTDMTVDTLGINRTCSRL